MKIAIESLVSKSKRWNARQSVLSGGRQTQPMRSAHPTNYEILSVWGNFGLAWEGSPDAPYNYLLILTILFLKTIVGRCSDAAPQLNLNGTLP